MFTTFTAAPAPSPGHDDHQGRQNRSRERSGQNRSATASPPSMAIRPKRQQVPRACDWCRLNRIRCDRDHPCNNCQIRGRECSVKGMSEIRSSTHATKEIERLRVRVKELEEKLKSQTNLPPSPTPPLSSATSPSTKVDSMEQRKSKGKRWEGAWSTDLQGQHSQLYGPSSSFYFMARLSAYVGSAFKQPHLSHHIQPKAASRFFNSLTGSEIDGPEESLVPTDGHMESGNLSPAQEEYFLGLFWQSYHCTIPIIDEREFKEHYESLRATAPSGGVCRKPSPLVDIVLALCMQYGIASVSRSSGSQISKTDVDSSDSSIAGRGFYRRCQRLLSRELENPSILTLRCHIFSVLYLRNASFVNTAHNTLAVAIRTAYILGLHEEPPDDLSLLQRELRRRLWWMVYSLETKACIALGRPWQAQMSLVNCSLPADDQMLAKQSGSSFFTYIEEATWLSYHLQCVTLIQAARAVHVAFYDKCTDILEINKGKSFYSDPQSLETIARFLEHSLQCIRTWKRNVPGMLKTARKGAGEPFSTDGSALEIDLFAPLWLQRQRILLELLYHNLVMVLHRPFICFSPVSNSSTPLSDGNAISSLNHAMAITNITNQILKETEVLNGWHEAYQFQWDAALSMIGFTFAYPMCPSTPSARKVIDSAISVFDTFGNNFAVAFSAANVTRDLAAKSDYLTDCFRTPFTPPSQLQPAQSASSLSRLQSFHDPNETGSNNNPDIPDIPEIPDIPDNLINPINLTNPINPVTMSPVEFESSGATAQNLLGLGFPIDSVGNLEPFWLSGNEIGGGLDDISNLM